MDFDAIVIGSGFGGAIAACRLAERGYRVLVLERGRRWDKASYPRHPGDAWLWNGENPEQENGWMEFRAFPYMSVASGVAVGGGSLISANISSEASPAAFASGWPQEITYHELKPYSDAVARFMNVQPVPRTHWAHRTWSGVAGVPGGARRRPLELAIAFDREFSVSHSGDGADPLMARQSRRFINAQGVEQGTCVHLGECEIGCDSDAKNTLDRNYIPWAEKHGAEVRALHLVSSIEPVEGGYRVDFDRIQDGRRLPGRQTARIVLVAAGSLGSTELLLRCRDLYRTLPALSAALGSGWNSNGDFLPPYLRAHEPASRAVGASADIDFSDHRCQSRAYWVAEGGPSNRLGGYACQCDKRATRNEAARLFLDSFRKLMRGDQLAQNLIPWFGSRGDAGRGSLRLEQRSSTGTWALRLDWDGDRTRDSAATILEMHAKLAEENDGRPLLPGAWSQATSMMTPQPLGGCNMAETGDGGVVDHCGEAFGYRNLFVVDGAIVPVALGANPSRTIGALAERCAALLGADGR